MRAVLVCVGMAILTSGIASCTDPDKSTRILTEQGYKEITITGYDPYACSDNDTFADGFTATNPNGYKVRGVVCSGFNKGATIRFK